MDEFLITLIGEAITIIASTASLAYWLGRRFTEIDYRFREMEREMNYRFGEVDKKLEETNRRFEDVDHRFKSIDERLNRIDEKLAEIDKRFVEMDRRFIEIDKRLSDMDRKLDTFKGEVKNMLLDLASTVRNAQEFMTEVMSYEGALSPKGVVLIRNELDRLYTSLVGRIRGNPLTKEELEEIGRYIKKDRLTLEEAYRFKELAWKLVQEYAREIPDVWKFYWYAVAWIGWAARMEEEERKKEEKGGEGGKGGGTPSQ